MMNPALLGIVENVLFLLAVALVYDLATSGRSLTGRPVRQVGTGIILGLIAVGTMMTSLRYEPGLIFDARSVVIGITGLFFGLSATIAAVIVAGLYRLIEGGTGAITGLLVIVASGGIGVGWRRLRPGYPSPPGLRELYLFGLGLHGVVLALMFTLPEGRAFEILPVISLPVLALYPLATAVLGLLLVRRVRRDTTARRLEESETRYRRLFEEGGQVMLVLDSEDGRIVEANPAAADFYGHSRSTLRAMSISRINTLPEPEVMSALESARAGERKRFQFRHRLADGSIRDVEVHTAPIAVDGRILLYSIVHDVSERYRAEAAVRAQTQALRIQAAALEAAANPIVITDRNGIIEWVNPAFTELTGYTFEDALGHNPGALLTSGKQDLEFFRTLWNTILDGRVWEGELINRKKDGTLYHESQTITPVHDANGKISHFIAIKQDLTDRMELQSQLAQAQKMEAVGQLAGGVAHDFNNLLTVINGTAQLALEKVDPNSDAHSDLTEIFDAGERAARLTRQLLTFSRQNVVEPTTIDLNGVIGDTAAMLGRLLPEDIEVRLSLANTSLHVREDPSRIEQVILNLCVNARDAMPDGGTLTLETFEVPSPSPLGTNGVAGTNRAGNDPRSDSSPEPDFHGSFITLRVSDTGQGIPPEIRSRIFEPFFTTKQEGKGTGLGLATVYGVVSQAGGDIEVDSQVGRGTTFTLRFPRVEKPTDAPPVGTEVQRGPQRARVLVVEDDATIRKVTGRILERAGIEVMAVASGREALRRVVRNGDAPDLILADVVMPGMTGPELAVELRQMDCHTPILFSSGYTEDELAKHGLDPAEYPFLAKPYTVEGLTAKVREVLGS